MESPDSKTIHGKKQKKFYFRVHFNPFIIKSKKFHIHLSLICYYKYLDYAQKTPKKQTKTKKTHTHINLLKNQNYVFCISMWCSIILNVKSCQKLKSKFWKLDVHLIIKQMKLKEREKDKTCHVRNYLIHFQRERFSPIFCLHLSLDGKY